MARSPLFRAVRRLMRRAHAERAAGAVAAAGGPSRRDVLRAAAVLPALPALAACGNDRGLGNASPVAIVGGGMAGLTAAYFLSLAGVRFVVFEAALRVGGRMYTRRNAYGEQLVELGGELVDTGHTVIRRLVEEFGLTLDDLPALTAGLAQDRFVIGGELLSDERIVEEFEPVAAKMAIAAAMGDGDEDEFDRIDQLSIAEWLEREAGLPAERAIRRLLEVAYVEEFGLEVTDQSAWNLITLIDYDVPDPFRVFGESDERFHIHEGSDAIPGAIAELLGDRIRLDHRLTRMASNADATEFELTFSTVDGEAKAHSEHVVYALPFTKLREVDLDDTVMTGAKRRIIDELGYGNNAKLMMQFTGRPWQAPPLSSAGSVISDVGELQSIWASSRGQGGAAGILTNFVGGRRGIRIGESDAETQAQTVLPWIEEVLPGTAASYVVGSAIRQHWASYEHTRGSYAAYRPGQWSFFGKEGVREGNQHFCGEHCSEDYQGYMEGAADTGALVAAEVLDDLGVAHPPLLASLLTETAARPRASYHGGFGERMKLSQIRRRGRAG